MGYEQLSGIVVATSSFTGTHDLAENLRQHHRQIDEAADANASLIVFPEISLHGYPSLQVNHERLLSIYSTAEAVPGGAAVREIAKHAIDREIYVVYGLNESGAEPGVIYNTAVLTGPDGHVGSYRKVHLHPAEVTTWRRGTEFRVFDTRIGRIGLLICYDKWWPESARELTLSGAELLICPSAWPGPVEDDETADHGSTGGIEGSILNRSFRLYDEVRALENSRWMISSNYIGNFAGLEFGGLSRIVDPLGRLIATTGSSAGLAIASIDVRAGIENAAAALMGPRLVRDRQEAAYRLQRGEIRLAIDG